MKIHKEGYTVILILFILAAALSFFYFKPALLVLAILSWIAVLFSAYFFRDPKREFSYDDEIVVSPADGTILDISEFYEPEFLEERSIRISIFMSVFNVHINRSPVNGKISYKRYVEGEYLPAFRAKASELNEQMISGYTCDLNKKKVLIKQIAGLIARRILFWKKIGDSVKAGKKIGMIKFGSRVDVYLPKNDVILKVNKGDSVKGGITLLAEFYKDKD